MLKKACLVCKIAGVFAIIGALNTGLQAFTNVHLIDRIFAPLHLARVVAALAGLSGLALLASFFVVCPACKK